MGLGSPIHAAIFDVASLADAANPSAIQDLALTGPIHRHSTLSPPLLPLVLLALSLYVSVTGRRTGLDILCNNWIRCEAQKMFQQRPKNVCLKGAWESSNENSTTVRAHACTPAMLTGELLIKASNVVGAR